jgi:protein TonB
MAPGLEPAFSSARPVWPLAGMGRARMEPDDPHLAIPQDALRPGVREAPERLFPADQNSRITQVPIEPLGPKPAGSRNRKWKLALVASCILHAAVALFFIQATDEAIKMEGADYSGEALLGNASEDQASAGDTAEFDDAVDVTMITMLEAKPVETIEAETSQATEVVEPAPIQTETIKPVEEASKPETDLVERTEPVPTEAQSAENAPADEKPEATETQATATVTETAPEVLATDRPLPAEENNVVQRPAETSETVPDKTAESAAPTPAETVEAAREQDTKPVEPVESEEVVKEEPQETAKTEENPETRQAAKPEGKKTVEQKRAAEKQAAKPKKAEQDEKVAEKAKLKKSGSGGQNQADTRRGQADGQEKGDSKQASRGGSKNGQIGNASVSNYPGKVASKLRRSLRYPAEAKRQKLRGTVQVSFVVSASGGVGSVRVVSSSGSSVLDKAAVETVRRAAPFPAIPEGAGRSTWPFSVPLAFTH